MKVTLEFERDELEKMIENHFANAGFVVKNMVQILEQFTSAFPEGLKVQADVAQQPTTPYVESQSVTNTVATDTPVTAPQVLLTMSQLIDPEPSLGRSETVREHPVSDGDSDFAALIKRSKQLEQQKRL